MDTQFVNATAEARNRLWDVAVNLANISRRYRVVLTYMVAATTSWTSPWPGR